MVFPFKRQHQEEGDFLLTSGCVKNIVFSGGTYQLEVFDSPTQATFWPFLQITDDGELRDAFCTCAVAEKKHSCSHLAAAFLQISGDQPLHVRFHSSFWNHLCFAAFTLFGAETNVLKKVGEHGFACFSPQGKVLFSVTVNNQKGKHLLDEYVFKRAPETEETSLKFSNLSSEELKLWRRGTPTEKLCYELSFWSDLAKWMLIKQVRLEKYRIHFSDTDEALPHTAHCAFEELDFEFSIAKTTWHLLIPSLKRVNTPLKVHELRDICIQKISYHAGKKEIHIRSKPLYVTHKTGVRTVKVGKWEFQVGIGFVPAQTDPLLKKKVIEERYIGEFLSQHYKMVKKYLVGDQISRTTIKPLYQLYFDTQKRLHISCFAFEAGDLQAEGSACFKPWVYLKDRGFYVLDNPLFGGVETVIPFEKVGAFISQHQSWLSQHEGFEIHFSGIELNLTYRFERAKVLHFENESHRFEGSDEVIDFGNWLYIQAKGFYKKLHARGLMKIKPETQVQRSDVSDFIRTHRDELEQIKSFFNRFQPIEKAGINVFVDHRDVICVEPEFTFSADCVGKKVHFLGDFTYVDGEGFAEIPRQARLPEEYREAVKIGKAREPHFVTFELIKLRPLISRIDPRLKRPKNLRLKVKYVQKDPRDVGKKWLIDLVYESEIGEESIGAIKKLFDHNPSYAITQVGLIFFKDSRFNWLAELSKAQIAPHGESVTLNTLEWIRLRTYEQIEKPRGDEEKECRTRELLTQIERLESDDLLQLDALKSVLRPYQKVGVKWLWFLYSYRLSGLLCDDMGLGKTHQAMGLLAAVYQLKKRSHFFVVCPTSVIYHWERLLKRFLPSFKVVVFYGTQRNIAAFQAEADLLLTSYGTLRSERESLKEIDFDVAIFDETQMAKNAQSLTHRALAMIKAKTKVGLTGTPIENRLLELKALFDVILPHYLPSQADYREHFINPIEKHQDQNKKALLSKLIHPFVLRRKKSEVLDDLPEKIEEIAHCELSHEQHALYKKAYGRSYNALIAQLQEKEHGLPYLHIFALFNTLKQICNHPSLVLKDIPNYKSHHSGKWDLFVELLNETRAGQQKLVVFTQYLGMIKIIETYLEEHAIKWAAIRGSTRDRKKQLDRFQTDPQCEVFVASLKAAGMGIDLTAASVVIHYDRWWNPAIERQATDRVHRIGQNRGVQVFKMVTKCTVEEHIHHLLCKKEKLLESVLGYDDQDLIKRLDRSDLIELLGQIHRDTQRRCGLSENPPC